MIGKTLTVKFKCGREEKFDSLRSADLEGANLYDADLGGANLVCVNLVGADLRYADLRDADLGGANLVDADLRGANFEGANLGGANLYGANLRDAKLTFTKGILSATLGKHLAFAYVFKGEKYVKIGCKTLTAKEWLSDFEGIGKAEGYDDITIQIYVMQIKAFDKMLSMKLEQQRN
jgi:uncharacterized protein YjbI with pentapeptide repeats